MTPYQLVEKKAYEEFVAAGGIEERDEDEKPRDRIQITWEQLPDMILVFRQTFEAKKEFLSYEEIGELERILSDYEEIQHVIRERVLMSPMTYDALNHSDETYLESRYPLEVTKNITDWVRKYLASMERQKACEKYVDAILFDTFLLKRVFSRNHNGMMIKFSRDSARQPLDDDMSVLSYECEKRRLDEITL